MKTVNIREAKAHLSRLIDAAVRCEPFIIAKGGKPLVKITAIDTILGNPTKRFGFMAGRIKVPDDFDRMAVTKSGGFFAMND